MAKEEYVDPWCDWDECPKCGHLLVDRCGDGHCGRGYHVTLRLTKVDAGQFDEHMAVSCGGCGYTWLKPPLDAREMPGVYSPEQAKALHEAKSGG